MNAAERSAHERQRLAYDTLVSPEFDIGVFAGIARVVVQGLACRGAGVARLVDGRTQVETIGLWLADEVRPLFKFPVAGSPCEVTLAHGDAITLIENDLAACFKLAQAFDGPRLESYYGVVLRGSDGVAIGILYALDDRPRHRQADDEALLKVAAARACGELLREVADEKIRESEARMGFALDAAALGMWEWDLEHNSWVYNDRWAEMRGYVQGEIAPTFRDAHPDDIERFRPQVDALLAGELDTYEIEYRTGHRNGEWRWVNSRTKIMKRASDGRPLRIVGIQRDIHEQRQADEAARANQQWLQLTIDAADLGVWDWDIAHDQITWSPRCASMLGYTADEMPSRSESWTALFHPQDRLAAMRHFIAHLKVKVPHMRMEIRAQAKDGRWVWLLINGRVTERDGNGRALRAVGTHQDVSPLRNAELALRESDARLRTVVENSPLGMFLTDADGAIVYSNPMVIAMAGDDEHMPVGDDWLHYVHPDDRVWVTQRWRAYVGAPQGVYDVHWRAIIGAVRTADVRVRASAICEQGRVLGFAGTLEDITEQRAAEQRERALQKQLQETQKLDAIGTLTGGVAHDFNNTLATILGYASLAHSRPSADSKLSAYLETIVQAAEQSRDLVRKLLDFSRSVPTGDVAALDAVPRVVDAARVMQAVIPATIRVVTRIEHHSVPVKIDGTEFQQLLMNLILNARDAIAGHGEISIALSPLRPVQGVCAACHHEVADDFVELAISDSGCGIDPAGLSRIFEPFYSTKEPGKGTGMGLSVLHGIVHRVGGHVLVESTLGRGTTMRVLLRAGVLKPTAHPAPTVSVIDASPARARRARVLVVDDETSLVDFLCEWLELEGFEAQPFTDPVAARAWAARADAHFDALLTDQTMPGLTGLELAQALRVARPQLPVVLCTGLVDRVSAAQLALLDVAQLFLKPVPLPALLEVLRRTTELAAHDESSQ